MDIISVDKKKCISCGLCAGVCPFTVLKMDRGLPTLDLKKRCLKCLHCAAACPQNAILYLGETPVLPDPLPSLPTGFCDDLRGLLTTRRSYRHFRSEPVDTSLLEEALRLADFAPSAKNQHPTGWLLVNDKKTADAIMAHILDYLKETGLSPEILSEYDAGNNVVMGTAPTLILGYAGASAVNPLQDTALALYTAELFLQTKGVGTCWAGYLTRLSNAIPALKKMFGLPEDCQIRCALMAGYPEDETYVSVPKRTKPASIRWISE